MSELTYDRLSDNQIQTALGELNGWSIKDGMLTKEFSFESYTSGVVFGAAVGHVADKLNHHPDLLIGYQKVTVSVLTHDAGGLTAYDFELARRISAIA